MLELIPVLTCAIQEQQVAIEKTTELCKSSRPRSSDWIVLLQKSAGRPCT